jgi:uncharacterized protein YkwD
MKSNTLIFTAIISLLMITSCASNAAQAAPAVQANAPTTKPTDQPIPSSPTSAPAEPSTPEQSSPAPSQAQPAQAAQAEANCTDSASFIADVTIPDNSAISKGIAFLKTWRIRNTGTCTWNETYSMVFVNGDQMNSVESIPFSETAPGELLDLSVALAAPTTDGAYTGNYELRNATGQLFLIDNTRTIWVKINVATGAMQNVSNARGSVGDVGNAADPSPAASNPVATGSTGACTFTEDFAVENDLVSQVNAARAAYDLPPLARNSKLSTAALSHSIDMACHSSISHNGSDGSTITGRMAAHGYNHSYWNEAIYAQPPEYGGNAQSAVEWWLNDPPHRVIILSPDAKHIGAGYAYVAGSKLGGYFTIDVGSPAP